MSNTIGIVIVAELGAIIGQLAVAFAVFLSRSKSQFGPRKFLP